MDEAKRDFLSFVVKITGMAFLAILCKEGVRVLQGKRFNWVKFVASLACGLFMAVMAGLLFRTYGNTITCIAAGAAAIMSKEIALAFLTINREDIRQILLTILKKKDNGN